MEVLLFKGKRSLLFLYIAANWSKLFSKWEATNHSLYGLFAGNISPDES